jgi:3-oxoacyl-[acyl-carrier protein] reductase
MIDPGLEGRVALITGANHGIGAATARALAAQGVRVFASYFRPACPPGDEELRKAIESGVGGPELYWARQRQSADWLIQEIVEHGGQAAAAEADLGNAENIRGVFEQCQSALGPVDILVNNHTLCVHDTFDPAGVRTEGFSVGFFSADVADAHFAVNARAYALMMSEYFRRYLERGANWGRIINISTDAAHAHPASVSYAATKHAIESYSRSAALETGKYGITVNIVAPGPIQTGWLTPEQDAAISEGTPLGRCGLPEDVADVIVFLASNQAHWLTGQLLYAGGGWRMHQ